MCLGAAGCRAVVAESFARIFFRNAIATGELYPVESNTRLCEQLQTGDEIEVDLNGKCLTVIASGTTYALCELGDAKSVIDQGGLFEYARQTGMIPHQTTGSAGSR